MFIIFGTRPYFQSNKVSQYGFCAHCDQFVQAKSFDAMRFFHLYFIPLIPTQGKRRNHKTCPKCKACQIFEIEDFGRLIHQLKEQAADALVAVMAGESQFSLPGAPDDGEPIDAVPFLHNVFDWIYASGNAEFCDGVLHSLAGPDTSYAQQILSASLATMRGNLDGAIESFGAASLSSPSDPYPVVQRAHLLVERKRIDEAIDSYQKGLAMTGEPQGRLAICAQMVDHQMARKQFDDAVTSYETMIEIDPSLAEQKVISKGLKRAKKKAGQV